jgi:hypothetical protein
VRIHPLLVPTLLVLALLAGAGCGIDHNVAYEPSPSPIRILATGPNSFAFSPTVSDDGRVVAWIERVSLPGNTIDRVIRWDRSERSSYALADTVWSSSTTHLKGIDLSADGMGLAGWISTGIIFPSRLLIWDRPRGAREVDVSTGFNHLVSATYVDSTSIVIGAEGPEGRGIYAWNPVTGAGVPLVTRFTSDGSVLRSNAWIDASGERACMEEADTFGQTHSTVYARDGRVLFQQEGNSPRFWRVVPGRPEGLMYMDGRRNLWGTGFDASDTPSLILHTVQDFDVSPDGGWLFARAAMGSDLSIFLFLVDTRDPR